MTRETAHDVEARRKIQQTPPDKHPCPKCGSERTKHSKRIAVCYACGNSWLLENICPECESEMEMTQVYESLGDFYSDGSYHWEWKCPKCGHEEAKKK